MRSSSSRLPLEAARCCICGHDHATPIATGEDFACGTTAETFAAVRCEDCGLAYLSPRPTPAADGRIWPPERLRGADRSLLAPSRGKLGRYLATRWLRRWTRDLPADARVIEIGCGDGGCLRTLRAVGRETWSIEGAERDALSARTARRSGFTIHEGLAEDLPLARSSYDLAVLVSTLSYVPDPAALLRSVRSLLIPGGLLVIVTVNVDTPEFALFGGRHWSGYDFPRRRYFFSPGTLACLAESVDLEVAALETGPAARLWLQSIRNVVEDWDGPRRLRHHVRGPQGGLQALLGAVARAQRLAGHGGILRALLRRPTSNDGHAWRRHHPIRRRG